MSYKKMMRHSIRKSKKQANMYFGFTTLAPNERRREPRLGIAWFEPDYPGLAEERNAYIERYHRETERMLKENPNLKLVD